MSQLGQVAAFQQTRPFTCGAATLLAVLKHWGMNATEPALTQEIGIDPKTGSTSEQVARAAKQRGFNARVQRFQTLDDARPLTARGVPIIAAIKSFNRPGQGHFVVVTDIDDDGSVRMMDPNSATNWRTLTRAQMHDRWLGRGGYGVIVTPPSGKRSLGENAGWVPAKNTWKTIAVVVAGWAAVVGFLAWRAGSSKAMRDF